MYPGFRRKWPLDKTVGKIEEYLVNNKERAYQANKHLLGA